MAAELMDCCIDILLSQTTAEAHVRKLSACLLELHVLSMEEWQDLVKPKVHMSLHIPGQITLHGCSVGCWSNERRNIILKRGTANIKHLRDAHKFAIRAWMREFLAFWSQTQVRAVRPSAALRECPAIHEHWRIAGGRACISLTSLAPLRCKVLNADVFQGFRVSQNLPSDRYL
jgi:hypothetical protein